METGLAHTRWCHGFARNRRKTGFTLPLKEWLQQESGAKVEFGKRTWARKVYETMFSPANGYY